VSTVIGAVLLDTGPWVALHCRDDAHHRWARAQFAKLQAPLLTCEAVVAETCFLLARGGHDPAMALALLDRGVVRTSEMHPASRVFTLDSDFHLYRQHGRRVIPLIQPG
jgi:uncharacterized protein